MILLIYPAVVLFYYLGMGFIWINGAFRELVGHQGSGHHHSRLHHVVWQFHTGEHLHQQRTYGGAKRLNRTANASNRTTPEGEIVYWAKMRRPHRALRNNGIVLLILAIIFGLAVDTGLTLQAMTATLVAIVFLCLGLIFLKIRRRAIERPTKVIRAMPPIVRKSAGLEPADTKQKTLYVKGGQVTEEKPLLDGGIPIPVMAKLLAGEIGCSSAETATRLTLSPDSGELGLPDHFPALERQRATIEEIVRAQTRGTISFSWRTDEVPRIVKWVPVVSRLPKLVMLRDYVGDIDRLPIGDFGVGVMANGGMYVGSHGGEKPWWCRSAGPGSGKSTGFAVKAAQILRQDPNAEIYAVDTKQVSFAPLQGLKRIHIYDDPESNMGRIWGVFFSLEDIMRDRYTALRKGHRHISDYNNIWLLVDEGNDLALNLKQWYTKNVKDTGDPSQPTVWSDAITPLINLGRQVGIRGEFMFQNMTDRVLGGVSLRDSFGLYSMAAYTRNQWSRIIGTTPIPECKNGAGRVMMVNGPEQTWVQGFYDDDEYLRDFATHRAA